MKQSKIDKSIQNVKSLIDFLKIRTEEDGERVLYFERQGLGGLELIYKERPK